MNISKEYWENPDNSDDNGYVYVCNICGDFSQRTMFETHHKCDPKALAKAKYWEEFYSKAIDDCNLDWDDSVLKIDLEPMKL